MTGMQVTTTETLLQQTPWDLQPEPTVLDAEGVGAVRLKTSSALIVHKISPEAGLAIPDSESVEIKIVDFQG